MKQFPGESVSFISGTTDGSLSVVLVEADADPARSTCTTPRQQADSAAAAGLVDRPRRMATKQPFEFAARDGLQLQAT